MAEDTKGITVKKSEDIGEWYAQAVAKAEIADYAPIRGFMVVRPNGYALWQSIMDETNRRIKALGVRNAYFPLLIPESFFHKEAAHAEGFSPEVAWIERQPGEQERYAIRPTSETIMYDSYGKWIRSWRDLPLKMNQWCSVVRWEIKDTKMFFRSREFLWQEGHCVYETEPECHKETLKYLEIYRRICEELLALPVLAGRKTERERFAGAVRTYTVEGFMPDGKAIQLCTSHDLGQGFAKAFNIRFLGKSGQTETPWQNSWGSGTRYLGATIMMHGDDKGLVLPPRLAERKAVIVPIFVKDEAVNAKTLAAARSLAKSLKRFSPVLDDRTEHSVGWKFNEHELQGIPVRVEIGPKDLEKQQAVLVRRDTGEKAFVPLAQVADEVKRLLDMIQDNLYNRAKAFLDASIREVKAWEEFLQADADKRLIFAPHCGREECEAEIKEITKGVTARCIPLRGDKPAKGTHCVRCGQAAKYNAYWARAY